MENIKVLIEMTANDVEQPQYAKHGDAGMDIRANEDVCLAPGETKIIKTGLKMAVDPGIEIQVRPRSGLSCKTKLRICNTPGTIDSGYRDEIGVIMQNTSKDYIWVSSDKIKKIEDIPENHYSLKDKGNNDGFYDIKKGDRIAQIVFCSVYNAQFREVKNIEDIGINRNGGFGSSGLN